MRFYSLYLCGLLIGTSSFMFSDIQHSDEFKKIFAGYAKCIKDDCDYRELRYLQEDIKGYESKIPDRTKNLFLPSLFTTVMASYGMMASQLMDTKRDVNPEKIYNYMLFCLATTVSTEACIYGYAYFNGTIEREKKEKAELQHMKRWVQIELEVATAEREKKEKAELQRMKRWAQVGLELAAAE